MQNKTLTNFLESVIERPGRLVSRDFTAVYERNHFDKLKMHALGAHNIGWVVCAYFRSLFHALKNQMRHRFFQAVLFVEFTASY